MYQHTKWCIIGAAILVVLVALYQSTLPLYEKTAIMLVYGLVSVYVLWREKDE
jgi:uncharacterized membrane protein